MDVIVGFQKGIEEPFWLREWNDPETGRSQTPAEVRGLHQVVSESRLFDFYNKE